jgi:methanogenic corrinoid protein MtbC1
VKVIVGGAPVTRKWAEEIGADGYGKDAVGAVALAKSLVGKSNGSAK